MSGLLSHSQAKNSIPVWFHLFWWAEELHALSYALLLYIIGCKRSHTADAITSRHKIPKITGLTDFMID